ncbi:MAG: extracellular solute-binding protein [Nitriliruptorales bacterium]
MPTTRLLALVALLSLLASACISAFGDDRTVRIYTGRHYDLEQAFQQFADETGIDVEFLNGGDAELRERILAEEEDTLADVYMTVDAGNLHIAEEQGIFQPLRSDALEEAIPAELRDPDGHWFGLSLRARTIVYSPERVDPSELSTYEALADPRWQGRVCMRNSTNVYTQSLVASLIAHHGREEAHEIVAGWARNAEILNSDIQILETIASGGCDVGITNHYYLARLMEDDPDYPVEVFWPNQGGADARGVHVNISGAGVTRWADDPDLARQLIEWLATDGQNLFVDGNHEFPVNPAVEPEPLIAGFGEFERDTLNAGEFGGLNAEAVRLMDEVGYP